MTIAYCYIYINQAQRARSSSCFNSMDNQTGCSLPLTLHARVTNAIIGSTAPEYLNPLDGTGDKADLIRERRVIPTSVAALSGALIFLRTVFPVLL